MGDEKFLGDNVLRPYHLESKSGLKPHDPYFIDVICSNYDIGNFYQIAVNCSEWAATRIADSNIEEIEREFWSCFLQDKLPLLDYHYDVFLKNGGEKLDFLYWLERSFLIFKNDREYWVEYTDVESFTISEKYLKEWIEETKKGDKKMIFVTEDLIRNQNKPNFSLRQVALMLFYQGHIVTRKNGNEIARKYGHNSGEKLFQLYTKYCSSQNRRGREEEDSDEKNTNKLKLFEKIIPHLSAGVKQQAIDDMNALKAALGMKD
jgi:hypothetical protein